MDTFIEITDWLIRIAILGAGIWLMVGIWEYRKNRKGDRDGEV